FAKKNHNNGEFSTHLTGYFDKVKLIYPSELIPATPVTTTSASSGGESDNIPSSGRNTFTESLSYSQVINQWLQASVTVDGVYQNGYLGLPFHRVYFADGSDHVENLPSERKKLPIGI